VKLREIAKDDSTQVLVDSSFFEGEDELLIEEEEKKEEPKQSKQLRHLHHLEDLPIVHGSEGFHHAIDAANKTHQYLTGSKPSNFNLQTKFDGSPSVVFGHHPTEKKFFVATKAAFNKTPKLNFNDGDIDTHHGKTPALANKLKILLKHLRGVAPREGIYQGDYMYSGEDVSHEGENLSFTPNTITYNVKRNSDEGRKVMKSLAGIAAHTTYEMDTNGKFNANYYIDMSKFKQDGDVHFLSTKLRGPHNYKGSEIKKYADNIKKAQEAHQQFEKMEGHIAIDDHRPTLLSYINDGIKNDKPYSVAGYINFLNKQVSKRTDKIKDAKSITKLRDQIGKEAENVAANKRIYEKLFQVHSHIQAAKDVLVGALSRSSNYNETILGQKSKPEGFVASVSGKPIKFVDRKEFSKANFEWNQQANPEDNPTVLTFGRMNPPQAGHEKVLKTAKAVAKKLGAKQKNVVSAKSGDKKNPLTPSQKTQWLKSMFPGQDLAVAGEDETTIRAQLQHLYHSDVKDVTIVAGADRVETYKKLLAKYNGPGKDKWFNFRRVRVVSAGARDNDDESSTNVRKAAKEGDYKSFSKGMPKHLKPKESESMFHDLRAQMGVVKIDHLTSSRALSIYGKRTDKIGKQAQKEIERRKRHGIYSEH
jgi:hypothetical protein